jgi:hypothetical protein
MLMYICLCIALCTRTFIGQDKKGSLFAVSVFNVANGVIRLGDVLGVVHPLILSVDVTFDWVGISLPTFRGLRRHVLKLTYG